MRTLWIAVLLMLTSLPVPVAWGCGTDSQCEIEGGYYLVAEPDDWDGESPLPVVVYFHGWNGVPERTMKNTSMVGGVTRRGALFVVPYARTGYWRQIGPGRAEGGRDERAYIRAVMADVSRRWPVDWSLTMTSGFSRGGSMSWNAACYVGDLFAGHAPIAGGFWGSTPDTCPTGPVNMRHIHGLADRVVAYDEVGVYNSMPIPEGLVLLRRLARTSDLPSAEYDTRRLRCYRHDGETGHAVEICLHSGGHSIPGEWVGEGLGWLRALPPTARQVTGLPRG